MRFSLKTLLWGTLLVALALVCGLLMFPKPVDVEFAKASMGPLRMTVQEDGKTRIREKYTVSAPVTGRLSRIELNAGDYIDEQTLLAVILPSDPAMLDARTRAEASARVQVAQAAVHRSQSKLDQAKIDHELSVSKFQRAEKMLSSAAVSRDEFEIARAEQLATAQRIETASFEIDIAKFEQKMAETALNQFRDGQSDTKVEPFEIYAPIAGRVLRVLEESSMVVAVGTSLVELGDPRNLEIEIDVLSTDAVQIKEGAEVTIEHWGGQSPLQGHVRVIEPGAFTKVSSLGVEEQRVNIIADFNEPPERIASLGDGYRVEARITVNEVENTLLVRNSALFRFERRWHVLSIVNNQAELQHVKIGMQNETHAQITDGLSEGDRVIIYPSDKLKPGTKVRSITQ
ncbi:MAG: efflux RND transporter periplasmic adaptor subunit [Rubripirellula sp.]